MKRSFLKAEISQHADIEQLMLEAFTPYVQKLGNGPRAGPYPWLTSAIRNGDVYVATSGDRIVGVTTTIRKGDELVIGHLGVDPAKQGMGIGSWMLDQIEQVARQNGVKTLSLKTAEMMSDLLRLYDRHGFRETRRAPPRHGDDEHLRIHMKKTLE